MANRIISIVEKGKVSEAIDPECALAAAYAPAAARARLLLLWRLDATLARIATTGREPTLAAIKLLWWRDALAALDAKQAPAEPLLQAIAEELLPVGVSGTALARIAMGWAAALPAGEAEAATRAKHAAERGASLFTLAAALLGEEGGAPVRAAGEGWALVDLSRRLTGRAACEALAEAARRFDAAGARRWPRPLRPLGMLAVLAGGDAARPSAALPRQGSPRRIVRMMGHRLTGF